MRDYQKEFKGNCLTCQRYDIYTPKDATTRGYRCTYHCRPMAMDEKCPKYAKDITRSNERIDDAVKWLSKHGYEPRKDNATFCYITTMLCDILGYPDNHIYLESLRTLRNDFLINKDFGKKILLDYDVYGSLISKKLYEEYTKNKDKVVSMLNGIIIPDFLNPLVELIERKDYENAMFLYIKMTFLLMKRYKIHYYPLAIKPEEIDTNNLGHGYSLTRKINVF